MTDTLAEFNPLPHTFDWEGRHVRWASFGAGPTVVFCHGTPWSSALWRSIANATAVGYTVYLWDMPGYGQSSKDEDHPVSLDVQARLFADLLEYWDLDAPHVVAHDYGGAVSLRAHLLHGCEYTSLSLIDVVALKPWGSDFFRLVRDNADVFKQVPPAVHEGAVKAYISTASHRGLTLEMENLLSLPWLGAEGQRAFYQQIAEADERFTDEIEPLYKTIRTPTTIMWGEDDTWIPVDRAHRLAEMVPNARLHLVKRAGHLAQTDQPEALTAAILEALGRAET
ncbi:alpha/beta fold hydrolase [Haloglycomyces albus]|uniref:alpha/beta fold hydrolase n=1 Tax=Haloglycomyces albus TaxID=526067 RepID=UPI00046CC1F7|nr:alpha/beta hydrolase [Haloglycomyces albus]